MYNTLLVRNKILIIKLYSPNWSLLLSLLAQTTLTVTQPFPQQTDLHATVSKALKTIAPHRAPTLSLTANLQTQLYLKLILGWSTADVCTLRIALFKAESGGSTADV